MSLLGWKKHQKNLPQKKTRLQHAPQKQKGLHKLIFQQVAFLFCRCIWKRQSDGNENVFSDCLRGKSARIFPRWCVFVCAEGGGLPIIYRNLSCPAWQARLLWLDWTFRFGVSGRPLLFRKKWKALSEATSELMPSRFWTVSKYQCPFH